MYKRNKPSVNITQISDQEGVLNLDVDFSGTCDPYFNYDSTIMVNEGINLTIKVVASDHISSDVPLLLNILIFVKFEKTCAQDTKLYGIIVNSEKLNITDEVLTTDNPTWYLLHEIEAHKLNFDIKCNAQTNIIKNPNEFIYHDMELTDLKLIGYKEASVSIHKAVLASLAPHFLKKFQDKQISNEIRLDNIQEETLKHFKDYLYLQVISDKNVEQLLLLAIKMNIPQLEQICVEKIIDSLTADKVYMMTKFAHTHKITNLYLKVLECVENGRIKVKDIKNTRAFEM